jgi:hypothetical protein
MRCPTAVLIVGENEMSELNSARLRVLWVAAVALGWTTLSFTGVLAVMTPGATFSLAQSAAMIA